MAVVGLADCDRALTRRDWQVAVCLAGVLFSIAASVLFSPTAAGSFHDDGIYISTAKALAEGSGYTQINLPAAPAQTKYPVLYPLMLAVAWKMWPAFPANLWLLQALTLVTAAAAVGSSFLYIVRFGYASRTVAASAATMAATTPFFLYVSTRALSEMPFAALTVVALWRLELLLTRDMSRRGQFVAGLLIGLPFLCRSIGVAWVLGAILLLGVRRRPIVWVLAGTFITIGPWICWSTAAFGDFQRDSLVGYYTDYVGSWTVVAEDPWRFIAWNTIFLTIETLSMAMTGVQFVAFKMLGWTLSPVFIPLGGATWVYILRQCATQRPLPIFLACYVAIVLAWPWPPSRFLIPVLPFLLVFVIQGASRMIHRLTPASAKLFLWSALVIGLGTNLYYLADLRSVVDRTKYPTVALPLRAASWTSYEDLFSWVRHNTSPTTTLAAAMDSMVYLYTGRQAYRPYHHRPERLFYDAPGPKGGTPAEIVDALKHGGATHLILFPLPGFRIEDPFVEAVSGVRREYPKVLTPVFIGRDPRFVVFKVHWP